LIRETDDHGHVIANHHHDGVIFKTYTAGSAFNHLAIQYNRPTADQLHAGMVEAWRQAAGRYSIIMSESKEHLTDMRPKNWAKEPA